MPALKILFVDSAVGFAGGQAGLMEILKSLDPSKFQPIVASPAASAVGEKCRAVGVEWHPLPFASVSLPREGGAPGDGRRCERGRRGFFGGPRPLARLKDPAMSLYGIGHIAALVNRLKIDLVHANTFKAALVCGFACALSGRPMVFHDRTEIAHGLWDRLVDLFSSRIVAISKAVGAKRGARAASKVRLIHDGVDAGYLTARAAAPRGVVGYLGRINEEKGLDLLVESAATVVASRPGVRFVIGGAPFTADDLDYCLRIRQRVSDLGLDSVMKFVGEVPEARAFLEGLSLLVVPSRREGLGIVVLEAMSLERPVVAFRVGGIPETLTDGLTGVLVAPGDIDGLARAIMGILDDPAAASRMGSAGRERVLERFTGRAMAESVWKVYLETAGDRRWRRGPRAARGN